MTHTEVDPFALAIERGLNDLIKAQRLVQQGINHRQAELGAGRVPVPAREAVRKQIKELEAQKALLAKLEESASDTYGWANTCTFKLGSLEVWLRDNTVLSANASANRSWF